VRTAATPAPALPGGEYVVQHGDTLFSISRRYGTTVAALVARNDLASPDAILAVGQKLAIP
jgi:LysM repeat protein